MKKSLFHIGDCLALKGMDERFYGIILFGINISAEHHIYDFILCGTSFETIPTMLEIKAGGLLARTLSTEEQDTITGFHAVHLSHQLLTANKDSLIPIGFVKIKDSKSQYIGSGRHLQYWNQLQRFIVSPLGTSATITVMDFEVLQQAQYPRELKKVREFWEFGKGMAHPKAVALLKAPYFWDNFDEYAPFGSDNGFDAFYAFKNWRQENPGDTALRFIPELEHLWAFRFHHLWNLSTPKIIFSDPDQYEKFLAANQAIIAICFGQLVLEGYIEFDLKKAGQFALQRLLHPLNLARFREPVRTEWKGRLDHMLALLDQV